MVEDVEDRAGQLIAETALGRDMVEREIPYAEPEPCLVAHGAAECRHIGNAVLPVGVGGDDTVILAAVRQLLKIAQAGFQRVTLAAVLLMAQHRAAGDLRRQRKNRGVVRAAATVSYTHLELNAIYFSQREGKIMYEDKTLVCKECGKEFVFTAGEQDLQRWGSFWKPRSA